MDAKKSLAEEVTAQFHGAVAAERARQHFERRFQDKKAYAPEQREVRAEADGIALLGVLKAVGFVESGSEARRLLAQRAVRIDDQVASDPFRRFAAGEEFLLAVGRRRLARVRVVR